VLRELKGEQGFVEVGGLELTKKKKMVLTRKPLRSCRPSCVRNRATPFRPGVDVTKLLFVVILVFAIN
jgi:hypothetical protein